MTQTELSSNAVVLFTRLVDGQAKRNAKEFAEYDTFDQIETLLFTIAQKQLIFREIVAQYPYLELEEKDEKALFELLAVALNAHSQ